MAGCIAEAFFGGIEPALEEVMNAFLPNEFIDVVGKFEGVLQVG
jgi:hypothetical protein